MKKFLFMIAVSAFFTSTLVQAANLKVGVYDFLKVWQADPEVVQMQNQLKNRFRAKRQEILAARKALNQNVKTLNAKSAVAAADSKKLQNNIVMSGQKLRAMQINFKRNFIRSRNEAANKILLHIRDVIAKIAKAKGLNLVITQANLAYSDNSLDITHAIIKDLKKA